MYTDRASFMLFNSLFCAQVLAAMTFVPSDAEAAPLRDCVRRLAADDLRRLLFAATGVAALSLPLTVFVTPATDASKTVVSFEPNFGRIDVHMVGDGSDFAAALGAALVKADKSLH